MDLKFLNQFEVNKLNYETWSEFVNRRQDLVQIPCGKCIECRLSYAREWAVRCMFELKTSSSAYFITLTYSDMMAPRSYVSDPDTGEALPVLSLRKKDFQLFMKRLRKAFPSSNIRY